MPGSIIFKPLEVNLTQDTTLFGKPDPYCIVSLGDQKIQTQIGEVVQSPQEEDYLALQVEDEPTCLVELKDHDNLTLGDNIGVCRVSLEEIESMGTVRKWYPIYDKEHHPTGKILLEATFTPENQTPTDIPEDNLSRIDELDEDTMESKEAQEIQMEGESKEDGLMEEQGSPSGRGFSGKKGSKKKTRYLFDQVGGSEDKDMEEEEYKVDPTISQGERKKSGGEYRNSLQRVERKSPILDNKDGQEIQEIQMDKVGKKGGALENQTLEMKWDV